MEASARTGNELASLNGLGDALGRGVLPAWVPYAVVLGVAAVVAALLAATGSFGIVLLAVLTVVVSAVVLYVISRTVEGSSAAGLRHGIAWATAAVATSGTGVPAPDRVRPDDVHITEAEAADLIQQELA